MKYIRTKNDDIVIFPDTPDFLHQQKINEISTEEIKSDFGDSIHVWGDYTNWEDCPPAKIRIGNRVMTFQYKYDLDLSNWEGCNSEPVSVFE